MLFKQANSPKWTSPLKRMTCKRWNVSFGHEDRIILFREVREIIYWKTIFFASPLGFSAKATSAYHNLRDNWSIYLCRACLTTPEDQRSFFFLNRAVFTWLKKNQYQSNNSDQKQREQTARWTNQNSEQLPVTCSKRVKYHVHKVSFTSQWLNN